MTRKAAKTGPSPMVMVAIEQEYPAAGRILTDELAYPILPLSSRFWVLVSRPIKDWIVRQTEEKVPGLWAGIMVRKRYIDEIIAGHPAAAVVNLGAGFDTRAYRLPALAGVPVWEVDLPANLEPKRRRLRRIFGDVPEHVTLVPIDFDREDLGKALAGKGYPGDASTFFIWEGVTQYLSEEGVRSTLEFLARAPGGSRLVFTYIPQAFIDGTKFFGQEYLHRRMLGRNRIWHFGIEPGAVDRLLGEYGWRVCEDLGYDELGERYVRPTGRDLGWIAIERIVHAEKAAPGPT